MNEYIKNLIIDYLQGKLSEEEIRRLRHWLDKNEENREYFNKIKSSWILSGNLSAKNRFDDEKLWNTLQTKLNRKERDNKPGEFNLVRIAKVFRVAAQWLIIFLLGSSLTYLFTRQDKALTTQKTAIFSPLGSKSQVLLPDGTLVWLNAGSLLEYGNGFNTASREVKLTGEGYFEVSTNPEKPFVVNAGNIAVKALGTSFNVKAYPEEKKVVTTLVKGEVVIEGKDNLMKPFAITLQPKQNITYYTDSKSMGEHKSNITEEAEAVIDQFKPSVSQAHPSVPVIADDDVKTELYTSWKDSRWIIEGEKLSNLSVMFERRFNVSIFINSEELKDYRFSGTIENETLEQVFQILQLTVPVDYTIDTGKVYVKIDKKLREKYKSAYEQK